MNNIRDPEPMRRWSALWIANKIIPTFVSAHNSGDSFPHQYICGCFRVSHRRPVSEIYTYCVWNPSTTGYSRFTNSRRECSMKLSLKVRNEAVY